MIKRIASITLEKYLRNGGATLIVGPKFCGKTYLAEKYTSSQFYFKHNDNLTDSYNLNYILEGAKPRLLDEWQYFPQIWDEVKYAVDKSPKGQKTGLYILTGSSSPLGKEEIAHSGAGRILKMNLYTLTFAELLDLDKEHSISLSELFENRTLDKVYTSPLSIDEVNQYMFNGGWPYIYEEEIESPQLLIDSYIQGIYDSKTKKYYDLIVDKEMLDRILISISRRIGTQIEKSDILRDLNNALSPITLEKYLQMLSEMEFTIKVPCWFNENIRSSYRLTKKPKVYLCDTSIFCSVLKMRSPNDFYKDVNSTGFVFENQVMKDLMVYCQAIGARLYFYRDERGNEIDAIIDMDNGKWAAIEIKLSYERAVEAANTIDHTIKTMKMTGQYKEPTFRMVICNCDKSSITNNGVLIVPHAVLRP